VYPGWGGIYIIIVREGGINMVFNPYIRSEKIERDFRLESSFLFCNLK
jgi:hypothetical protein